MAPLLLLTLFWFTLEQIVRFIKCGDGSCGMLDSWATSGLLGLELSLAAVGTFQLTRKCLTASCICHSSSESIFFVLFIFRFSCLFQLKVPGKLLFIYNTCCWNLFLLILSWLLVEGGWWCVQDLRLLVLRAAWTLWDGLPVLIMAVGVDTNNVLFWEEIDGGWRACSPYPCLNLVSSDVGISPFLIKPSKEKIILGKKKSPVID